ncbi:late secretory pathway protein AVL9 homolog [Mercenaria mercenaria]|uniref:late secretory pathway protein AVL9 homolog n=1 Tax=Mercenaria mercenaria TaxID=6596 RepID=UPI00234E815B|nr:late secretory pathway protein AVL9 homolog [Mercenaria mercenaria]
MSSLLSSGSKPVLHVVVIGFHHKKGCQVEYSYPPLKDGGEVHSNECPPEWKHLPSLAVPDGAHNYIEDTIYFHLPEREGTNKTVYGVACYRQIDAKELKIKTDDITRSTVQKSVCVLSNLPLYGLIQAKLELITHAYFQELDFSRVSLLEETYNNLNASLTESLLDGGSQVFLGMDIKDLVQTFRHKVLVLFKLILLERRVLFTGSPVEKLGNTLLSVLSLYPGMIEHGLVESTAYGIHKQISPTIANTKISSDSEDFLEIRYSEDLRPEVYQYYSNEPESPTMDRGGEKLFHNNNTPNSKLSSHLSDTKDLPPTLNAKNSNHFFANTLGNCANMKSTVGTDIEENLHYVDDHYAKDENGKIQKAFGDSDRAIGIHKRLNGSSDKVKVHRQMSDTTGGRVRVHNHVSDNNEGKDVARRQLSDTEGGRVKVPLQTREITEEEGGKVLQSNGLQHRVVLADSNDVILGLAHYEAVQAGKNIPKNGSIIDTEHCSLELKEDYFSSTSPAEGPIPTPDPTAGELGPVVPVSNSEHSHKLGFTQDSLNPDEEFLSTKISSEKVDELDSPESINQIDREDCFSWEDDKLSLTIDTDKTDHRLDDMAGLASSFKEISVLDHIQVTEVEAHKVGTEDNVVKKEQTEDMPSSSTSSPGVKAAAIKSRLTNAFGGFKGRLRKSTSRESSEPSTPGSRESSTPPSPSLPMLPILHQDEFGFPLAIFTKGCVCFPYLSLQYFDLLNDVNIRSFVIGATNMLFRHKRHLTDVVVDVAENKVDIHERELQKQLILTTADLRFADIIVKAVTGATEDGYFDGTEWEGNDEWLRAQFRLYLEGMLAAVLTDDPKLIEDFGVSFIHCWKTTHNYKVWASTAYPGWKDVQAGHPCQGHLSVADIKVRFAHTMNNTEGGKKINAAVSTTGKYVVQTGKAVGGALTQAKSSLSSWFSNWKSSSDKDTKDTEDTQT